MGDPFCQCGYRKSVHDEDRLPEGSGCKPLLGGFRESSVFNASFMLLGRTSDTPLEAA